MIVAHFARRVTGNESAGLQDLVQNVALEAGLDEKLHSLNEVARGLVPIAALAGQLYGFAVDSLSVVRLAFGVGLARKFLKTLVGVTGFEPATSTSRT